MENTNAKENEKQNKEKEQKEFSKEVKIEELEKNISEQTTQIEQVKKLSEDYKETLQRLQAEFENSRKRMEKEKDEFRKFIGAKIIEDFLPLMDTIDEALKDAAKKNDEPTKIALQNIRSQFAKILGKQEVREIQTIGKKFDLQLHEGLMMTNEKDKDDGAVLEEFQKGYTINGKVLRPAKVKVNKKEKGL